MYKNITWNLYQKTFKNIVLKVHRKKKTNSTGLKIVEAVKRNW